MNRFLKPVRNVRWMNAHISQPTNPPTRMPLKSTIARNRDTAAMLPRSRYLNGRGPSVAGSLALDRGGGVDAGLHGDLGDAGEAVECHHVPDDVDLGVPGQGAVGQHRIRPARSTSAPVASASERGQRAGGHAGGPDLGAAGDPLVAVRAGDDDLVARHVGDPGLDPDVDAEPGELVGRLAGEPVAEGRQDLVAALEQDARWRCSGRTAGSCGRASGGRARRSGPATSTPVGPPPTTAKVSQARRSSSSSASSAISNAPKIRVRSASASSTVFMVGACGANSGWPKYELPTPMPKIR